MFSQALAWSRDPRSSVPTIAAGITAVVSGLILLGWIFDVAWLRAFSTEQVSMKFNTAGGFLVCACLLVLTQMETAKRLGALRWSLESVLLALGVLTLVQYAFGVELGLDEVLVEAPSAETMTVSPGRMAPTTAVGFVLVAGAFMVDHWRLRRFGLGLSRLLAALVLVIALTSLIGYAYGEPSMYLGIPGVTAMALSTALLFSVVAIGIIWLHPSSGIAALLTEQSLVSTHVRALLIMIICAPLLVGAFVSAGYGTYYEGPTAVVISSVGSVLAAAAVAFVSIVVLRRAESALYVKDRALAAARNGVVITDHRKPDEPIVFVNDAFTAITGYSNEECVGRNCRFLNTGVANAPERIDEVRRLVTEASHGTVEFRNRRKDGSVFWNRLSLAPIRNHEGAVTHLVGVIDDVTETREQGERLQRALDDARAAHSMRDTFIHAISHELRTPLNAALTWLRLMELDDSPETRAKGLSIMAQSIESQSRLIDDLVDATRIATTSIKLEAAAIDARELIETTVDELRPGVESSHELVVSFAPGDYRATLDPVRIQQIVRNLLNNAAKYTPAGGLIEIEAHVDDGFVCFTVRDTGKGLTEEHIEHLFDPFWRADSSIAGLGVGLSIVEALVKAHGGTISVESAGPGAGSVFAVRLPRVATISGHAPLRDDSRGRDTSARGDATS